MRTGFTTGSCAAAAAKAATYMLLTGKVKETICIITPKGIPFEAAINNILRTKEYVSCSVTKDGGDDPDVTTGCEIYAKVFLTDEGIAIDGGEGVGRVTLPGLDQKIGNAAINHVPRQMITEGVKEVMDLCDYSGGVSIIISVPGGESDAQKTFNPKLGIEGGISIIGTSGIVEPMSMKAIKDTIEVEIKQQYAMGKETVVISPGNYGLDFMKKNFDYDLDKSVKCSNFIGDSIDMARTIGFKKILLVGHIGKLIKLSGGIMNTHSKEADCRMELMAAAAIKAGVSDTDILKDILECVTTESAIEIIKRMGILEKTMDIILDKALFYLRKRAENIQIECIMYSNEYGLLAKSDGAILIIKERR